MKIATKTFHGPDRMTVVAGEAFPDDADVVQRYPDMFADAEDAVHNRRPRRHEARPVESATRRPGELSAARRLAPNESDGSPDLEEIDFTSDAAAEAAAEAGLAPEDFEGREGTGKDGAFTKADVQSIAEGEGEGKDEAEGEAEGED